MNLNSYISNNTDNFGYFVFLGYIQWADPNDDTNPNHPFNRGLIEPNGINPNCFGLDLEFLNPINAQGGGNVVWVNSPNNPYTTSIYAPIGKRYSYNHVFDRTGLPSGYYGFMYIEGDKDLDSVLGDTECGGVTCFEIEVIEPFPDLETININICTSDINNNSINLANLLVSTPFNAGNIIAGGLYTQTEGDIVGSLDNVTGLITNVNLVVGGFYQFQYNLSGSEYDTYHDIEDPTCQLQKGIINISIEPFTIGNPVEIAVCNNGCILDALQILNDNNELTVEPGGTWVDTDNSGATITNNLIDLNGVPAGVYVFTYEISGGACSASTTLSVTIVESVPNPGDLTYCDNDNTQVNIFTIGTTVGLIPFVLGTQYQVYINTGSGFIPLVPSNFIPSNYGAGTFTIRVCILRTPSNIVIYDGCECCIEFNVTVTSSPASGVDVTIPVCN